MVSFFLLLLYSTSVTPIHKRSNDYWFYFMNSLMTVFYMYGTKDLSTLAGPEGLGVNYFSDVYNNNVT